MIIVLMEYTHARIHNKIFTRGLKSQVMPICRVDNCISQLMQQQRCGTDPGCM